MSIQDFVNRNPKYIHETDSTTDMIEFIRKINFPILVLPLLDQHKRLKGAISFHKLLKEE
jgi:Mg/Co/Ni transporter MgtE